MLLVDTSVWIDFFRRAQTPAVGTLIKAIQTESAIAICGPVLQEILQGAINPDQFDRFHRHLAKLPMLKAQDPTEHAVGAAMLYMRCRQAGITIRSSHDCSIVVLAIEHNVQLLHTDRDFTAIAQIEPMFDQTDGTLGD